MSRIVLSVLLVLLALALVAESQGKKGRWGRKNKWAMKGLRQNIPKEFRWFVKKFQVDVTCFATDESEEFTTTPEPVVETVEGEEEEEREEPTLIDDGLELVDMINSDSEGVAMVKRDVSSNAWKHLKAGRKDKRKERRRQRKLQRKNMSRTERKKAKKGRKAEKLRRRQLLKEARRAQKQRHRQEKMANKASRKLARKEKKRQRMLQRFQDFCTFLEEKQCTMSEELLEKCDELENVATTVTPVTEEIPIIDESETI